MDKVRELETKLNEIVARFVDLEEIGFDDLNAAWKEIDEVKQEASTLVEDLLVGATRQENGRFKSRSDIEFDIHEIAELTSSIDKLTDRAYSEIHRISIEERHKKDLFFEKGKRRNEVRQLIRTNNSMIASLEAEIKSLKTQLGDPGLTDEMIADLASRGIKYTPSPSNLSPEKQYYLENELKAKEASLQSFKDANEMYRIEEERLTTEMGILKHGGRLEEPSLEQTPEEPEKTEGEPEVTPVPFPTGTETPEEPEKTEDEPEVTPVPFPVGPETPEEPEKTEDEPGVVPVPFPVGPETPEGPEVEEPVTPVPFPVDPETPEEPEEEPIAEEPTKPEEEEEEEYEPTPAPLPLWKKITLGLMGAATLFLGAIAAHTGFMAHDQDRMADSLEHIAMVDVDNQSETKDEEKEPNNDPDNDEEKNQEQGKNPSSGDKDVNPGSPTEEPTPAPGTPEPGTPKPGTPEPGTPEPGRPEPGRPAPGQSEYEKENGLPVHLDEGEVVIDESTGISVNHDGDTYKENEDGSLTHIGNQDLEESKSGSTIVGEDELKPSIPLYPPITGEEKTAEEAELTQGEQDALEDALSGISGEDALDEEVSEAHAVPATGEDYTQASEQSELDRQTDADIANFFSSNGIFDALNDGQALMR
ncbi:MAG: hypothetical protein MSH48_01875 [Mollicutes bacterium]|nr:hypothetical protein [Mollicutes bacterium]